MLPEASPSVGGLVLLKCSDAQAGVASVAASKRYRRVAVMTSGGSTLRSRNAA
jgi:hypothetical protein